jgi:hypothetical protein
MMENLKITRSWGMAAAIFAVVVCVAGGIVLIPASAGGQGPQACCPVVVNHWLPQPILEAKFTARVLRDNQDILNGLQAFAKNPHMTPADIAAYVGNTYLKNPRFWTSHGWVEGWGNILAALQGVISPDSKPTITSITVLIEYQPYTGAATTSEDIDAEAKIRMTFSASPDGHTFEGALKHSRICEII